LHSYAKNVSGPLSFVLSFSLTAEEVWSEHFLFALLTAPDADFGLAIPPKSETKTW